MLGASLRNPADHFWTTLHTCYATPTPELTMMKSICLIPSLPALVFAPVFPALLGRNREGEVDVAAHVPVVLVLVRQLRDELGREGDEEALRMKESLTV